MIRYDCFHQSNLLDNSHFFSKKGFWVLQIDYILYRASSKGFSRYFKVFAQYMFSKNIQRFWQKWSKFTPSGFFSLVVFHVVLSLNPGFSFLIWASVSHSGCFSLFYGIVLMHGLNGKKVCTYSRIS